MPEQASLLLSGHADQDDLSVVFFAAGSSLRRWVLGTGGSEKNREVGPRVGVASARSARHCLGFLSSGV